MRPTRAVWILGLSLGLCATRAHAVPSFARQTGLACSQCHTVFPELTPFGRRFKGDGYTLAATRQLSEGGQGKRVSLEVPEPAPLGAMAVVGFTHTQARQQVSFAEGAPPALNDDVSFPQQLSLFYAGKIAPKLGAFIQLTYEGTSDHLGLDNTELRFAHAMKLFDKPLVLGATLNNNPTVSDLWNSTPAWGVPFTSSSSAPSPEASTLVEGTLAQAVLGAGVYGYFNGTVYAEVAVYRSAPLGMTLPLDASTGATSVIDGVMPYWRVAVEKDFGNHSVSLGTFGLTGGLWPGGASSVSGLAGPSDRFTDLAVDGQYQYIGPTHVLTGTASYIHESQTLNASAPLGLADHAAQELHRFKLSASYLFDRLVGARVTFATLRGSSDLTLYARRGPRSTALTGEVFVSPWQNTRLGLQLVGYLDFDGAATNYDGLGRNAADNDTLYAYLWVAF